MKINKINVKIFKIKNRRDYAALFANHLTEGKTPQQTFERMVKAATIFLLFLFIFSCLYNPCYAAPAYGVKMPDKNHFFFGLQSYSLLKKQLEADNGKMCSLQHFFLITYGLSDWFSIDLKGGGGNIKQSPDVGEKIKYASYLGGGYGFRIRLYEKDAHKAVFGFQHISIHPHKTHRITKNIKLSWMTGNFPCSLRIKYPYLLLTSARDGRVWIISIG
ncbi:MAG: hypothetical protein KJ838_05380 [Candidatus Omnitrophica bacterium]|nr:hypothetical protein [Candidatus Omnitrophota bacterium]